MSSLYYIGLNRLLQDWDCLFFGKDLATYKENKVKLKNGFSSKNYL